MECRARVILQQKKTRQNDYKKTWTHRESEKKHERKNDFQLNPPPSRAIVLQQQYVGVGPSTACRCCWREQVNTSGSSRPCVGQSGKQEYFIFLLTHSLTLYLNSLVYLFSFPWDLLMNENVHTHLRCGVYECVCVRIYIYIMCVCVAHTLTMEHVCVQSTCSPQPKIPPKYRVNGELFNLCVSVCASLLHLRNSWTQVNVESPCHV